MRTPNRLSRRPTFDILEDRRPVAESIGAVASVIAMAGAAQASPPPPCCAV